MILDLIEQKTIDHAEIIVILFEHCNLRCRMCTQDHESVDNISREQILSKTDYISKWINDNNKTKYFKLHIMGGEVFEDFFTDKDYLDIYVEFMNEVKSKVLDKNKDIVFNFVTNLVFENTDKVKKFLDDNDLQISTSYDSRGRFSSKDLEVYKRNIEIFKDKITMVSCVMTSGTMKAVRNDKYFKYLYDNFIIDWDHYWPASDIKTNRLMMPSERDTLEFYKFLIDNYPNCLNVEHFVTDKPVMKMTCTRGNNTTIKQDNSIPFGCSGTAYVPERKTPDEDESAVVLKFFTTYDCFSCEYLKKCPFTCFIKQDYKYLENDLGECVFKETFKYAEEKFNS